ncbi:uncharacterized protein BXZ73DRAFT_97152 [Epithele typhae]|uniref:uncharacterized protein n=1 Tax=Epithele typhae TaxID=378194 RepID=UPI002007A4A1|nr:uncharacterized protein BXZ73DRAFT_97152 [Epithele typhae]KAH9943096.1 hypothetical protein BXZ73DRAFT_97152 [Epithele typhae]
MLVKKQEPPDEVECAVTHVFSGHSPVEDAHVVPAEVSQDELAALEWSWDLIRGTFDVNARENVIPVTAELRSWFDLHEDSKPAGWLLLPAEYAREAIKAMYEQYVGEDFTENEYRAKAVPGTRDWRQDPSTFYPDRTEFQYRLVPLPSMSHCLSVRYYTGGPGPFKLDQLQLFVYPFGAFPTLTLRIPLHHAIVNSGQKLFALCGDAPLCLRTFSFLRAHELVMLCVIRDIYLAWVRSYPSAGFRHGENTSLHHPHTPMEDLGHQSFIHGTPSATAATAP